MEAIGISAEQANASLNEVDETIRGLPIGLDEAALDIRRTTQLLGGDVQKATKFVEGFDQALIAGGAPEQMRNYSYIEMQRLLTSGELGQSRQWMSLVNGLGVSTTYLKDAMGYAEMTLNEFEKKMYAGDFTGQQVIEGFAALADNDGLKKLLDIYKTTLESGLSNIHYSFVRGLQRIFDSVNETMKSTIGMDFDEYMKSGRDFIDRAFLGVADWIRSNPDTISSIFDRIEGLAKRAEKFDWGKLAGSIIGSIEKLFDIATWVYDHIPEGAIQKFLTFSLVWASPLGKAFSALGGLFTTLATFPLPNFGKLAMGTRGIGRFVGNLKGIGKGFLGASAYIGIIAEIGAVIFEYTKVAESIAKADLSGFDQNVRKVAGFVGQGGSLATILTGIFTGISATGVGAGVVGFGELLSAGLVGIIAEIGAVIGEYTAVAEQIAKAKLPSQTKIERVMGLITTMSTSFASTPVRLGSRMKSRQLRKVVDLIQEVADALPAFEEISKAKIDKSGISDNMESIFGVYGMISDAMDEFLDGESGVSKFWKTRNQKNVIGNVTDMIGEISDAFTELEALKDTLNRNGFFNSPTGEESPTLKRLTDTMGTLMENMETISQAIESKKSAFANLRKNIVENIKTNIIKAWTESIQAIADLGDAIAEHADDFKQFDSNQRHYISIGKFQTDVHAFLDQVEHSLEDVQTKLTAFGSQLELAKWQDAAAKIESYYNIISTVIDTVEELKNSHSTLSWTRQITKGGFTEAMTNLQTAITELNKISFGSLATDRFSKLEENVQNINSALVTIMAFVPRLKDLSDDLADVTGGEDLTNLQTLISNLVDTLESIPEDMDAVEERVKNLGNSIESIETFVQKLTDMQEQLAALNSGDDSALANLRTTISTLNEILGEGSDGAGAAEKFAAMAAAVESLQGALTSLQDVSLADLIEELKQAKSGADKLKSAIDKLKTSCQNAYSAVNRLKTAVEQLANVATSKEDSFNGLISAISNVASVAGNAYSNVSNLASAISNLQDKTITLTVNTPGLSTALNGLRTLSSYSGSGVASIGRRASNLVSSLADRLGMASGGEVPYLANGGSLFKPKGTDTVPAMLTPGEWVIRRKAVQTFGNTFMQKINNMDINGAMDALMSRSHWMPNGSVSYVTNNYNNQAVTQHFHRDKDSRSSYRRASRYVGAL